MQAMPTPHDPRSFLRSLLDVAVKRALPDFGMAAVLPPAPRGRTVVLGAGKAAAAMAQVVDQLWPQDRPLSGLVVTRYGHVPEGYRSDGGAGKRPRRIEVVEAAHPVPDAAGLQAAQRIAQAAQGLSADDLVLCLISGGASALLSLPAPGLTLQDKQAINTALLRSGAAIDEMNCVRKHLSAIKGGRLAAMCAPAPVVTLLISDVPGDAPQVIGSGPTVPDPTTCADALAICDRYGLRLPDAVRQGLRSAAWETPKPGDAAFAGHRVHLLATPLDSLRAAAEWAKDRGVAAHILGDAMEGESSVVGRLHADLARFVATRQQPFQPPCVLLSGGETTVTVRSPGGRGGRAGEFLLGAAVGLKDHAGVWVLAADTDGIDGSEDNAGAVVTPDTWRRAAQLGLNAADYLQRHDSYSFFAALGDLVVTGPTFTNVNDFRAVLIL